MQVVKESIAGNENLFREVLTDMVQRESYLPSNIDISSMSLDDLLDTVPRISTASSSAGFTRVYLFAVGDISGQFPIDDILPDEVFIGYDQSGMLSGGGAILKYKVKEDKPYFKEYLLESQS